jgi:hypothetical protein
MTYVVENRPNEPRVVAAAEVAHPLAREGRHVSV